MVSLRAIQASNAYIPAVLPSGLVAIFVGGTSGIGEYTLKEFARLARQPRIYNNGRSQQASDRIAIECKKLNANAQYTFIQADISLIRVIDAVCEQIKAEEKAVNVLFLSAGTLVSGVKTEEGLHFIASLKFHSRARFILNLLPLLKAATGIRRVVSVLSGTKEGTINLDDLQGWKFKPGDIIVAKKKAHCRSDSFSVLQGLGPLFQPQRGHGASIVTLVHAHFAQQAPTVSFIQDFPGNVRSGIARGTTGLLWGLLTVFKFLGPLIYIPDQDSGERHLYFMTSARFRPKEGIEVAVPLNEGVEIARGVDGIEGSGVYSTDQVNENAGPEVVEILERFKKEGMVEKVWEIIEEDYKRITKIPKD